MTSVWTFAACMSRCFADAKFLDCTPLCCPGLYMLKYIEKWSTMMPKLRKR